MCIRDRSYTLSCSSYIGFSCVQMEQNHNSSDDTYWIDNDIQLALPLFEQESPIAIVVPIDKNCIDPSCISYRSVNIITINLNNKDKNVL